MRIAIIGYGKMGHAIEAQALQRGHEIGLIIDTEAQWAERGDALKGCDVAVEFTMPATAVANIRRCFAHGVPVVAGTTGWYDQLHTLRNECEQGGHALFVASNFSIGMNIMFDLNKRLATLMQRHPAYEVSIEETHHIHKLDAPSGTAITLASDIVERLERKERWGLDETAADCVSIHSVREGEVPGTHEVTYHSAVDTLRLSHEAHSREGLALGAVLACEYLADRTGFHTIEDLLG